MITKEEKRGEITGIMSHICKDCIIIPVKDNMRSITPSAFISTVWTRIPSLLWFHPYNKEARFISINCCIVRSNRMTFKPFTFINNMTITENGKWLTWSINSWVFPIANTIGNCETEWENYSTCKSHYDKHIYIV